MDAALRIAAFGEAANGGVEQRLCRRGLAAPGQQDAAQDIDAQRPFAVGVGGFECGRIERVDQASRFGEVSRSSAIAASQQAASWLCGFFVPSCAVSLS